MSLFGFFDPELFRDRSPGSLNRPKSCFSCGLYRDATTKKMEPWGKNRLRLLCIGEAPGEKEDFRGKPWQGKAGERLRSMLETFGIDLDVDCLSFNAVNCRPPRNRTPTDHEIGCCHEQVVAPTLASAQKRVVLLLGSSAVRSVIGSVMPDESDSISVWRGWTIPDQTWGAWLCPVFHPSYVERESEREEVLTIWRSDIERALRCLDRPLPDYGAVRALIRPLYKEEDVKMVLKRVLRGDEGGPVAIDYETTGLKPQANGHKIICASFCTTEASYSFLMPQDPSHEVVRLWKRLLKSPDIGKVAHNMKYEDTWSNIVLGTSVYPWVWDTMLGAHVLDNRKDICGLKFQTYVRFGIAGYDRSVSAHLRSAEKNSNTINNLEEVIRVQGPEDVLVYCALDSLFTRWLYLIQREEMKNVQFDGRLYPSP